MADGVANDPFSLGRGVVQPLFAERENEGRVILGDVAEVIGNAAAHVEIGIIFERFENRKDRSGIDDEGGNTLRPRQSRTGSFRAQAADMRIGVTGPILQPGQGASGERMMNERMENSAVKRRVRAYWSCIAGSKGSRPPLCAGS